MNELIYFKIKYDIHVNLPLLIVIYSIQKLIQAVNNHYHQTMNMLTNKTFAHGRYVYVQETDKYQRLYSLDALGIKDQSKNNPLDV